MSNNLRLSIEILKRIPKKWKISAPEMQKKLANAGYERSLRSIERQLLNISEQFDIERDTQSKPYGYKWKSQAEGLNLPTLSIEENVLLTLADKHLKNLLPEKLHQSLDGYFKQAKSMLLHDTLSTSNTQKEWLEKVDVVSPTQPLIAPEINQDIMTIVSNALFDNRWLEIKYRNANDYEKEYRVMPLSLVQQDVRLYLVCRFEGYENERNLAIHRIKSARQQTLTFKPPTEFKLKNYIAQGRFSIGEGEKINLTFVVLKEAGKHLFETPLSKNQKIIDRDKYLEISADVIDSEILNRWLTSFGKDIINIEKKKYDI